MAVIKKKEVVKVRYSIELTQDELKIIARALGQASEGYALYSQFDGQLFRDGVKSY